MLNQLFLWTMFNKVLAPWVPPISFHNLSGPRHSCDRGRLGSFWTTLFREFFIKALSLLLVRGDPGKTPSCIAHFLAAVQSAHYWVHFDFIFNLIYLQFGLQFSGFCSVPNTEFFSVDLPLRIWPLFWLVFTVGWFPLGLLYQLNFLVLLPFLDSDFLFHFWNFAAFRCA